MLRMFAYLSPMRWPDIYIAYIIPNWRVVRILSHWMRYFLPLSDFSKRVVY